MDEFVNAVSLFYKRVVYHNFLRNRDYMKRYIQKDIYKNECQNQPQVNIETNKVIIFLNNRIIQQLTE